MIEIVCPNCQARYQLPDGAIGPDGRKVSCTSCSHKWRAHPETTSVRERSMDVAAASLAPVANEPPASLNVPPPPAEGGRDEQMAAIRKMLNDLKESAKDVPDRSDSGDDEDDDEPSAPIPSSRRRDDDDVPNRDSLKGRIEDVDKLSKMIKGEPTASGYDAAKLRKRHEKRAKRMQKARDRRRKSGAFFTGFTFVVVVTCTFTGLYVFSGQISAASPKMGPAMTQYANTVDRYRIELKATADEWKEWVTNRVQGIKDKAEKQGFVKPEGAATQAEQPAAQKP